MKKCLMVILSMVLALSIFIPVTIPAVASDCPQPPECSCCPSYEGLTPGFWKNHTDLWVGYSPNQTLESVFDIPDVLGLDNYTLIEALNFGGGSGEVGMARNLLRQAVAALLNASHPDINYPVAISDIISWTNGSLASLNRDTMEIQKNWWNQFNNLGGGIDAHGNPI